jgi:hypothetical protein
MGSAEIPTYLEIGAKRTFAGALDWAGWCRAGRDEAEARPIEDAELRRFRSILRACWRSFDAAVDGARGETLAKGPRGGGRDRRKIVDRVVDAEGSYLRMVGRRVEAGHAEDLAERIHAAVLEALETTARHVPPPPGPRGGTRWLPRYFVRRVTWHVLDQAWEIEDRAR